MKKVVLLLLVTLVLMCTIVLVACNGVTVVVTPNEMSTTNQNPPVEPPVDDPVHVHTEEIIPAVESTCTQTGLSEGKKCSECGEILAAQQEMPIKAHTEVIDDALNATCTQTGLTEGKHCSVCGTVIVAQQEVPVKSHVYDDKYDESCNACGFIRDAECAHRETDTIKGYDATCTATGLTDGSKCKKCGEILLAQEVIGLKAHTEVIDSAVNATCTSTGLTEGKHCSVCGAVIVAQTTVGMKPHIEIVDPAVEPTYTSVGYTEGKHCGVCGLVLVPQTTIPKLEYDITNSPVKPVENITVLGNENAVLVSDLFVLKDGAIIPEGAELVVFNGAVYDSDSYTTPMRVELQATSECVAGVSVDIPRQIMTNENFHTLQLQFSGISDSEIVRIAVMHNGIRISDDVIVTIVDGCNVRDYAELTATLSSGAFTKNIVLLDNLTMTADVNTFNIGKNYTLYGNGYKLDIKNGILSNVGIINLQGGTIRDIMIVGAIYSTFAFNSSDEYGSSAVNATGNAYIYNSYIANTRSPLKANGNITIEDSVLFGGRYSNVDMTGGTLTVKGTVTTVQQLYNDVIGVGVSTWFNDSKKNIVIEDGANLVQYNFMDQSIKNHLPVLSLAGYELIDTKQPFDEMFSNTAMYENYMYTSNNGNKYINFGMMSTDKYMLDYTVGGDSPTGNFLSKQYKVGAIKKLTTQTLVSDYEEFIVAYDTRFTPRVGEVVFSGCVKVTGAQLKAGVEFVVNTEIKLGSSLTSLSADPTGYWFQIQSDNYKTVNVSGVGSVGMYNSLTFTFAKDSSSNLALIDMMLELANNSTMHDKGIHYGKMCLEIYTPEQNAIAYGTTTYHELLDQYIEMTDGDGEGDNFYTPENFKFVNGRVSNYWE